MFVPSLCSRMWAWEPLRVGYPAIRAIHSVAHRNALQATMSTLKRASRLVREEIIVLLANMQAVRASTRKNTKITLTQYSAAQRRSTSTTIDAAEVAGVSSLRPARLPSNVGDMTTKSYSSLCGASGRILVGARLDTWCGGGSGRNRRSSLTARSSVPMGGASMIGPGAGETVTSMGVVSMQRQGMSSTTMSEQEFHSVADEALEEIHDAVEEALEDGFEDDFDCNMSQGVLNIIVGDRGTWVLNKQSPNRQIWWSSPISGPMRFEYHEESKRWLNTRDGETELRVILATEMSEKCGVSV